MQNLIGYIEEYGSRDFDKRPFCDADSIVLAQLSYLKFDGYVPDEGHVLLRNLKVAPGIESTYGDHIYGRLNKELFEKVTDCRRFKGLGISHYVSITDDELETQFCAVTFDLPCGITYVAYRGTDETIVGWKEDFNLTYMTEIPAQRLAIEYLSDAADRIEGPFYVGGHSKGGHLSIYAAMHSPHAIQDRLISIYSLDGPGFMKVMLKKDGYERIREKIRKYLPQSSLIGMLQERDDNYDVIKSTGVGLLQHNLYTWLIEKGELVPEGDLKDNAKIRDEVLNDWIEGLTPESRQKFVDTLYEIISACDAKTRGEFLANFVKNSMQIINTLRDADPETVNMLKVITGKLFESAMVHYIGG